MPCVLGRWGGVLCLPLDIAVCCNSVINKRTSVKALLDIYPKLFLSPMPSILLPHFIPLPSLPYPAPLHTLLSHFPHFLHPSPCTPSFFHSLPSSLPLLGSVFKIPAHSDERKNNNTTLQPEEARARDSFRENSETREKRESKQ